MRSRKAYVLGLGALGLATALTAAALVAPNRASAAAQTYVPRDAATIVAHVPPRDARHIAERQALAAAPDRVELAVAIARDEIERARRTLDPRHLGRAQATLARWWNLSEPPADVLLLRATIKQSLHLFTEARADLDRLIALRPHDAQAHLTRAVVATVTADYGAARESCAVLDRIASPLVARTCSAPLDALGGDVERAYRDLATVLDSRVPISLRGWALTTLGELALQRGDEPLAGVHFRAALALDPGDAYARAALADVLIVSDPAAASQLLAGHETADTLLVRRAIAEDRASGPDADRLASTMRQRLADADLRDDRVHLREAAMFVLAIDTDPDRALELALANWHVQKELADARLFAEAALEARKPHAAASVVDWARKTGVRDARLAKLIVRLGGMR